MDRWEEALQHVDQLDEANSLSPYASLHGLSKLLTAVLYVVLLTSIPKARLDLVLAMGIWLYAYALLGRLSAKECFRKLWGLFLLLFLVGIANPILDRQVLFVLGRVPVTSGMLSMLSLFFKGALALLSAYFLAVTTGLTGILSALALLHVPNVLLSVIYLIFRYLSLLFREAQRVWTAYSLRAPGQRGIHISSWGSLAGSMLIRSMDRAELLYQSMELRGYDPRMTFAEKQPWEKESTVYLILSTLSMLALRLVPVFSLIGSLLLGR